MLSLPKVAIGLMEEGSLRGAISTSSELFLTACNRWYRRWTLLLDHSRALRGKYACSVYPRSPLDY